MSELIAGMETIPLLVLASDEYVLYETSLTSLRFVLDIFNPVPVTVLIC